jgi:hypothetical protein
VCNERYTKMYGLSREQAKPGSPVFYVLVRWVALLRGKVPEDPLVQRAVGSRSQS